MCHCTYSWKLIRQVLERKARSEYTPISNLGRSSFQAALPKEDQRRLWLTADGQQAKATYRDTVESLRKLGQNTIRNSFISSLLITVSCPHFWLGGWSLSYLFIRVLYILRILISAYLMCTEITCDVHYSYIGFLYGVSKIFLNTWMNSLTDHQVLSFWSTNRKSWQRYAPGCAYEGSLKKTVADLNTYSLHLLRLTWL